MGTQLTLQKAGGASRGPYTLWVTAVHRHSAAPSSPHPEDHGGGCRAEVLTGFPRSLAAGPMSTWVSSWRKSSHTRTQPPTMSWPGSTVIRPTLPLVRPRPRYAGATAPILEPESCILAVQGAQGLPSHQSAPHPYPCTGFKLAFNYLKDKKFVDAIEVCHSVSHQHGRGGCPGGTPA